MGLNDFYKFLESKPREDYIVKLRYKYLWESDWHYSNEILEPDPCLEVYEWHNDWDEAYDLVEVLGYIAVADVNTHEFKEE